MKKLIPFLACAATALLLAGCLPEEAVWWSHDGGTAAIRAPGGLYLADSNGQLSDIVLKGEATSAGWLPDGAGVVVSRSVPVTNWAAAEALIPAEEAAAMRRLTRAIPDLLRAALTATDGSLDDVTEKLFKPMGISVHGQFELVARWAMEIHRPEILAATAGLTNATELRQQLLDQTNRLAVHELIVLPIRNGRPNGEPRSLVRSLCELNSIAVSPRHPAVAFLTGTGALKVMALDGKTSAVVAEEDVRTVAWSPDGRELFYVVKAENEKAGEIRARLVLSPSGELRQEPAETETLAMAACLSEAPPRLAVLPDGRILFVSLPVSLPARPSSLSPVGRFFLLDPRAGDAPEPVSIKGNSLPDDLSSFALSPDGRFAAVVEGGADSVAVVELATGKVEIVSPEHPGRKTRLIPAWRNNHELTFAALPTPNVTRPELVLWQAGAPLRILSKAWPDSLTKAWIEAPAQGTDGGRPSR